MSTNKPTLLFMGPISTRSGYGDHGRDLVLSLIKMDKYDVKIISTRWGACPMNQLDPDNEDHRLILERILVEPLQSKPNIFVQLSVPNEFQQIGDFSIGITAGIETTVMPVDFVKGCNNMHLIIVPSLHAKQVMESTQFQEQHSQTGQVMGVHKVNVPIEILFEGSDINVYNDKYNPDVELERQFSAIPEDSNFLFVGHWLEGEIGQDRKDVGMLIKTFLTVFKNNPNAPGLILKTSRATFSVIDRIDLLNRITAIKNGMKGKLPNIYLLHGDLSPDQMNSLYNHPKVKTMISFTKGEGYGRPLQEFMFTGKPIIASNWSGHIDFLENYAELVGGSLTDVHKSAINKFLIKGAKWFTINYNEAAQIMATIHADYKKVYNKTKKVAASKRNKFSLDEMHIKFEKLLNDTVKVVAKKELVLPELKLPKLRVPVRVVE